MTVPRIGSLFRYPVKGCAGVRVSALELDEIGPRGDRRWMIVDPAGDRFFTLRNRPRLALVEVDFAPSPGAAGDGLCLSAPGVEELSVPVPDPGSPTTLVRIWNDRVSAVDAGDEPARWLSDWLDVSARLVRLSDDAGRSVDPALRVEGAPSRVGFADGYPLLLLSAESMAEIERNLPACDRTLAVERFRPNVVVEGVEAWEEDRWRRVRLGSTVLHVVKACARCTAVDVDPATGEKGREPLATLARIRRYDGQVYVGQNALHDGPGRLVVGQAVEVLDSGVPRPPLDRTASLAETNDGAD